MSSLFSTNSSISIERLLSHIKKLEQIFKEKRYDHSYFQKVFNLMTRARNKTVSIEKAKNSIFIDFEGEGRTLDGSVPMPHMLGTFRPKTDDFPAEYEAWFFKPQWKPVVNGSRGIANIIELSDLLENLIEESISKGSYLVYWTEHEKKIVEEHCPEHYKEFSDVGFNAKPPIDKMYDQQEFLNREFLRPNTLSGYMEFYFPSNREIGNIDPGAAESCRRLDKACEANRKWGKWIDKQKKIARDLLNYNKSDCRSTWKLTRKLANHLSLASP
jgi:hypothetical protein